MFKKFIETFEVAAEKGLFLLLGTISSIIIANSSWNSIYNSIIHAHFSINLFHKTAYLSTHFLVNDFLMSIFFLLIGIEIKKELVSGHLSTNSQRILPVGCAVAGVITPMLIYVCLNFGSTVNLNGWAIPTATDIAFVVAIMSVFSKHIPQSIKVFTVALAVIDDLIAILAIAIFYTSNLNFLCLFGVLICIGALYLLNKNKVDDLRYYFLIGTIMFILFCFSGIHATLAGVVLGLAIPSHLTEKIVSKFNPVTQCLIIPTFAFFNSGIEIGNITLSNLTSAVCLGVTLGLFLGKQIGIFGSFYLLVKSGVATMPVQSNFRDVYIASALCGIGFTMSIFISLLAFDTGSTNLLEAKIGILSGSTLAFLYSCILIFLSSRVSHK